MTHRISGNRPLSMPLRGRPPRVAALEQSVAHCRSALAASIYSSVTLSPAPAPLKRLEEPCGGTRETDGIVATVHNMDAVVLDLTYLIKEVALSTPHKASVQHVVHLKRGEWHKHLGV